MCQRGGFHPHSAAGDATSNGAVLVRPLTFGADPKAEARAELGLDRRCRIRDMEHMYAHLSALGAPHRLSIVEILREGDRSVSEICVALGLNQSIASKHLRKLREVGLVKVRLEGQQRIYGLEFALLARISEWFGTFEQADPKNSGVIAESTDEYPMLRLLTNARLIRFFYLIRVGGDRTYAELLGGNLLSRNMFSLIGNSSGIAWAELVALSGEDRGQVSRAVKMLTDEGLISRAALRAKIRLTCQGEEIFDKFMAKARNRDAQMTEGLDAAELAMLQSITHALTVRAAKLLAEEQKRSGHSRAALENSIVSAGSVPQFPTPLAGMVTPPLLRLAAYMRRGATIAYHREAGLSFLAWLTLTQIGEHVQLPLTHLSKLIGRDPGQVSRIVSNLNDAGIITKKPRKASKKSEIVLTDLGNQIYNRMCRNAISRDNFIFMNLPPETRKFYLTSLDILIANAERGVPRTNSLT